MANVKDVKSKDVVVKLNDGKERKLKFDLNALAELEDMYGTVDDAFKALDSGSVKAVRAVLWAGMLHDEPELTEREVGSLMDIQCLTEMTDALSQAFDNDMPVSEKGDNPN